jgi:hypothetical protein
VEEPKYPEEGGPKEEKYCPEEESVEGGTSIQGNCEEKRKSSKEPGSPQRQIWRTKNKSPQPHCPKKGENNSIDAKRDEGHHQEKNTLKDLGPVRLVSYQARMHRNPGPAL